jgi:4-hydroxy-tetrahydrodipicolinate synthase
MMPGTGCSITDTPLHSAGVHGCAGVLMLPPFYYKGVSEGSLPLLQRSRAARRRCAAENLSYHIPPVAVVGITTGLVERLLAAYPNAIAGMKDSWAIGITPRLSSMRSPNLD